MAEALRNPCTPDCPDRPNCKGCQRGNEWRQHKIKEAEKRYQEKSFHRYEMDGFTMKLQKSIENKKHKKRVRHR